MIKFPLIYLASQSARRQQLLQQLGVSYELIASHIDETINPQENPKAYITRMAKEKGQRALNSLDHTSTPILTADTIVTINNMILGKPKDKQDYEQTLSLLSNQCHEVMTCICLTTPQQQRTKLSITQVKFRTITQEESDYYWEHYHPIDKAGGYGIQEFAGVFVEWINGSYSNVVGLPLAETYKLITTKE